jgi:hypothetical protein
MALGPGPPRNFWLEPRLLRTLCSAVINWAAALPTHYFPLKTCYGRPSVVSTFTSNIATAIVAIQSNSACINYQCLSQKMSSYYSLEISTMP